MGKTCVLPDGFRGSYETLGEIAAQSFDDPLHYAVYLAARNTDRAEGKDYKAILDAVQEHFPDEKRRSLQLKLTTLVNGKDTSNAKLEGMLAAIGTKTAMNVQSQQAASSDLLKPSEHSPLEKPKASMDVDLPPRPGILRGVLQAVEFLAHSTGDHRLSQQIHQVVTEEIGEYQNPLLVLDAQLEQGLTRHNAAVKALPAAITNGVQQQIEAVGQAITFKVASDKAAVQSATAAVAGAWQTMVMKTHRAGEAAGNIASTAWHVSRAATAVFSKALEEGGVQDHTATMTQIQNHLKGRD